MCQSPGGSPEEEASVPTKFKIPEAVMSTHQLAAMHLAASFSGSEI